MRATWGGRNTGSAEASDLAGLGFAACQVFLSRMVTENGLRGDAFALGPKHRCGAAVAELVNAAANQWKHADDERPLNDKTLALLGQLGTQDAVYPSYRALLALVDGIEGFDGTEDTQANLFFAPVQSLETWIDEVMDRRIGTRHSLSRYLGKGE